jgi:hypothetical protein
MDVGTEGHRSPLSTTKGIYSFLTTKAQRERKLCVLVTWWFFYHEDTKGKENLVYWCLGGSFFHHEDTKARRERKLWLFRLGLSLLFTAGLVEEPDQDGAGELPAHTSTPDFTRDYAHAPPAHGPAYSTGQNPPACTAYLAAQDQPLNSTNYSSNCDESDIIPVYNPT